MSTMDLQDSITLEHTPSQNLDSKTLLLFFITGNPGLIEYYRTFLTLCFNSLRKKHPARRIKITGTSLRGFEIQNQHNKTPGSPDSSKRPYDLEQQIEYIGQVLDAAIEDVTAQGTGAEVILMGHSVGSYILLEVLRRRKQRASVQEGFKSNGKVIAGICLFPTVTHIAKSPSGKKFSLFFALPYFAYLASLFVRLTISWLPFSTLSTLVSLITRFPPSSANPTTAFLKSPTGVHQALYLATHEMKQITTDTWDTSLWQLSTIPTPKQDQTKLYFYFGTNDHWVADSTRDELIAARAATNKTEEKTKPTMEIDVVGTPHGFCIGHNGVVVEKVLGYVDEVLEVFC